MAENTPSIKINIAILTIRFECNTDNCSPKTSSAAYAPQKRAAPIVTVANNAMLAIEYNNAILCPSF